MTQFSTRVVKDGPKGREQMAKKEEKEIVVEGWVRIEG